MDNELLQFAKDSRKYLKLEDGEEYRGFYTGRKVIPDKFRISEDAAAKTIAYALEDSVGKKLEWTKNSGKIAEAMAKIPVGSGISIMRIKKGDYVIRPLDADGKPIQAAPTSTIATEEGQPS
jgi:hypothetical protein